MDALGPSAPPADQRETDTEQRHDLGLGNRSDRAEQPRRLAVDAVGEVERVGVAAASCTAAEHQPPEPAGRVAGADVDRDRAAERARDRIERVDAAVPEAEVADEQIAAERTEPRRREREAPWRRELAAADQPLQEAAVL